MAMAAPRGAEALTPLTRRPRLGGPGSSRDPEEAALGELLAGRRNLQSFQFRSRAATLYPLPVILGRRPRTKPSFRAISVAAEKNPDNVRDGDQCFKAGGSVR